jgi:hypothetical protein
MTVVWGVLASETTRRYPRETYREHIAQNLVVMIKLDIVGPVPHVPSSILKKMTCKVRSDACSLRQISRSQPDHTASVAHTRRKTSIGDASRSPPTSARGKFTNSIVISIVYKLTVTLSVRPSISIPLTHYPVYPAYLRSPPWPAVGPNASSAPSISPVASQIHQNPGRVPVNLVPSPFGGSPFDSNSHSSSPESNLLLDELVTPLEGIRLSEPFARRQSYPLTSPNSTSGVYGAIMSPTASLPSHYVDRFGIPSPKSGGLSHHSRRSSSQSSRKLAASYKSRCIPLYSVYSDSTFYPAKPCKFWRQDGSCPNGHACSL